MKEVSIEDVYYSYLRDGVIKNWKLEQVSKDGKGYQCKFRNLETGTREVKIINQSMDARVNARLEAIFCD